MSDENKRSAWMGNAPGGNYTAKVQALAEEMGVGVNDIDVAHDDWKRSFRSAVTRPRAPRSWRPAMPWTSSRYSHVARGRGDRAFAGVDDRVQATQAMQIGHVGRPR